MLLVHWIRYHKTVPDILELICRPTTTKPGLYPRKQRKASYLFRSWNYTASTSGGLMVEAVEVTMETQLEDSLEADDHAKIQFISSGQKDKR